MHTAHCAIRVNGVIVAHQSFRAKSDKTVTRNASIWMSEAEFTTRATLKASGIQTATVGIISDLIEIEHTWVATESQYGSMRSGVVVGAV